MRLALLACLLGVLVACRSSTTTTTTSADAGTPHAPTPRVALPPELEPIIETCKPKRGTLDVYNCDHGPWNQSAYVRGPGKYEELLALADDERPLVRVMAARALAQRPCPSEETCAYATNVEYAKKLLALAEAERDERVAPALAVPLARVDLEKTGLAKEFERFLDEAPEKTAGALLDTWLMWSPQALPSVMRFARSGRPEVRKSAAFGLRYALDRPEHDEVCALMIEGFGQFPDHQHLADPIIHGFRNRNCVEQLDTFLDKVEGHAEAGRLGASPRWLHPLFTMYGLPGVTEAQRARVLAFARTVSETTTHHPDTRVWAMGYAVQRVPDRREYVERLLRDQEPSVVARATQFMTESIYGLSNGAYRLPSGPTATPSPRASTQQPPSPAATPASPNTVAPDPLPTATPDPAPAQAPPAALEPDPRTMAAERPDAPAPWLTLRTAIALAVVLVVLAAVGAFFAVRRAKPVRPEPTAAGAAPADPPGAQRARGRCATHGIAVGPDGLCVLCRDGQKASPQSPRPTVKPLAGVNLKRVALLSGLGLVGAAAYFVFAIANTGARRQGRHFDAEERWSNPNTPSTVSSSGGFEYVSDVLRTPAREPGTTFYPSNLQMLTSPVFRGGSHLPLDHTCDGKNVSPPLVFRNVPINAKSLAVKLTRESGKRDPKDKPHWTIFNLPPNLGGLPEGVDELPPGAFVVKGQGGTASYQGPCPTGDEATYLFWVFALDTMIDDPNGVELPLKGHTLEIGTETASASYQRHLKVTIDDIPDDLRSKRIGLEECDPRGGPPYRRMGDSRPLPDRSCDLKLSNPGEQSREHSLRYRTERVSVFFTGDGVGDRERAARYELSLTGDHCTLTGIKQTCDVSFTDLRPVQPTSTDAPP